MIRQRSVQRLLLAATVAGALACRASASPTTRTSAPVDDVPSLPPMLLGRFVDDYGSTHTISNSEWRQERYLQMRVQTVHLASRYLVGTADARDSTGARTWLRIDWMPLDDPQWRWAYCIIAYDQPTAERAEADTTARRATPRTGCKGHPFTRMRPAPDSGNRGG